MLRYIAQRLLITHENDRRSFHPSQSAFHGDQLTSMSLHSQTRQLTE